MTPEIRAHVEHLWEQGVGIDQTIRNVARRHGVAVTVGEVRAVFVGMAEVASGCRQWRGG